MTENESSPDPGDQQKLTNPQIKLIRCLDGLDLSFGVLNYYYKDLHKHCCQITHDQSNIFAAMACSWGFVDTLHRIREISSSLPTLSKKDPELRIFLETTTVIENFRHYIQHLRSEISNDPPNTFPVWGSISWVDENGICHTSRQGSIVGKITIPAIVYDTETKKPVSKTALSVNDLSLNFDLHFLACERFMDFIYKYIFDQLPKTIKVMDKFPVHKTALLITKKEEGN